MWGSFSSAPKSSTPLHSSRPSSGGQTTGDTERIVFTMARAAPWVQDPAKDQQDFGSDTLKDWDLSRPPDPKGEHICRLQQSRDPHSDFAHQDVKRLKLAASEAPQEELLGRAGSWWGSRQPTAPTTPAQGRSEHSRALWIGMGWDEPFSQPGSCQSIDAVASETSKPPKTKAAFCSAPGITGPGMGHPTPDQHPVLQRLPAALSAWGTGRG